MSCCVVSMESCACDPSIEIVWSASAIDADDEIASVGGAIANAYVISSVGYVHGNANETYGYASHFCFAYPWKAYRSSGQLPQR